MRSKKTKKIEDFMPLEFGLYQSAKGSKILIAILVIAIVSTVLFFSFLIFKARGG
ncbi:hypothetical protein [Shewanella sp. UCD-FRSSP16_17]|uniref:hypothetical protein n=1 Tax=Shewanella sp. UCD-FRSSP16_17 TaxID=1853256 RepID=UPI0012E8C46B|nr:hypothetical protein [Shewanella sp. UCD-FRSSP16_17]